MASQAQRRQNQYIRSQQEEDALFDDLEVEENDQLDNYQRVVRLTKSPLHLLLMIVTPGCPIQPGDLLYVNVGKRHQEQTLEVLKDARLQTSKGVRSSLSLAAHVYMPWRKNAPDGWELVKFPNPSRPGKFISMNTLFEECWNQMDININDLEEESRLYTILVERGYQEYAQIHVSGSSNQSS